MKLWINLANQLIQLVKEVKEELRLSNQQRGQTNQILAESKGLEVE